VVFIPSADEMYPDGFIKTDIPFLDGVDVGMEGEKRPGHFDGVVTVVKKLFEIVRPHIAYFGQKDLSNKHIDFEADLIRKLIGNRLDVVKADIDKKSVEITDIISNLKKLKNLAEHFLSMRKGIESAVDAYNRAVGTFESRVLVSARKFRDLGISSTEELESPDKIDKSLRTLDELP